MEKIERRREVLIDEFENILIHAAHDNWRARELVVGRYHTPEKCFKREKRQDPPFCMYCHPWMRTWNELGFKEKEGIKEEYREIIDVALNEYRKVVEPTRQERR